MFKAVGRDHLVQTAVEATTRQTLKAAWKGLLEALVDSRKLNFEDLLASSLTPGFD